MDAPDQTNLSPTNESSAIPGQPDFGGTPNEHISPQQRAGEIAYYLQEAYGECRAAIERVEDEHAKQLFGQVAALLDQATRALFAYQGGDEHATA